MSRKEYLLLGIAGFGLAWLVALQQASPGYMDAQYYFTGGQRLAEGSGFSEMVLWNYLDDPAGLPHASHGYWMPLASLLAAAGMRLGGSLEYAAARWPFFLLAALVPPLAARLAASFSAGALHARLAGMLALFSGFYLAYLPVTETFGIYLLSGGLFFLLLAGPDPGRAEVPAGGLPPPLRALALGALAGGMHLARADGLLWLGVGWLALLLLEGHVARDGESRSFSGAVKRALPHLLLCLAGYLLVMGPWMLRNLAVFGSAFAPGSSRALWLTTYDELYAYPAALLTPERWWASGLGAILRARGWALGMNLQTALAVQAMVFLLPLVVAGLWRLRRSPAVQTGVAAYGLTLAVFTLVFPFQGARGGFLHSGAAFQVLWWAAAPFGLDACVEWGGRMRGWNVSQARSVFSIGIVALALAFTGFITVSRLTKAGESGRGWDASLRRYTQVETALDDLGAAPDAVVMVNNAPGYYASTRRPAISIPSGDLAAVLSAADRYGATFLVLEKKQIRGDDLFENPGDRPGLGYRGEIAEVHIYEILPR